MILTNVVVALSILGTSYGFKRFPPKEINNVVGYRTNRSMSSQEAWDFANRYSSDILFKCSIGVVIFQVLALFIFSQSTALQIAVSIWIVVLIGTIILTEQKLRKKF